MTSEVAVLNSVGVALAADSALTVGGSKVYASVDKLFQLHDREPVGVMVYGNATLATIPWETIIKEYRHSAIRRSFRHIRDYADDFIAFLAASKEMFPAPAQDRGMLFALENFIQKIVGGMYADFEDRAEVKVRGFSPRDIKKIVEENLKRTALALRDLPPLEFTPRLSSRTGKELAKSFVVSIIERQLEDLPLSKKALAALHEVIFQKIYRSHMGQTRSGLVFAGFGTAEFLPALVSVEVEEFAAGRLRAANFDTLSMSENGAAIVPFAQKEMVDAFMNGIHPELSEFFGDSTEEFFLGVVDVLTKHSGSSAPWLSGAMKVVREKLTALRVAWGAKSKDLWQPVLENLQALPKDEIAAMAEALVNLTKFRRRVSLDRETVGGPIDVAVITRGDGFVWIKRKHYFQPELNPRTLARISRGLTNEDNALSDRRTGD